MNHSKAVFFDRDGVINIDFGYVYEIENFIFKDGIFDLMKYLIQKKYLLFIVTNQSGISRGFYSQDDYEKVTNYMLSEFNKNDINITEILHCPHQPNDFCECRKPNPFMVNKLSNKFNINKNLSWMIGDKITDIEFALNAGVKNSVLLSDKIKETKFKTTIVNKISTIKNLIK